MSDILIRGMKMPTSEEKCKFFQPAPFRTAYCVINGVCVGIEDCPLVPVPPHGDLIDKDATMNEILEQRGEDTACWFAGIVNDMTAIIPSDKAEEGET